MTLRVGTKPHSRIKPHYALIMVLALGLTSRAQMITSQYDNARTGGNLTETKLTPRNVNPQQFGKLFALKVDGDIYAQPLFLADVQIPGKGRHDVVFVATEHDSVYAFDAYGNPSSPLWHVSFLKQGVTTVPADNVACPFIVPEVGITSTPVMDAKTGTLYVLVRTKESKSLFSKTEFHQRLHALAVTTGVEKFGGPADIHAQMRGLGTGSTNGILDFAPLTENPRAALLLANGMVYLTWASSCDVGPYHGWVMAYDAQSLQQKAFFNASPDADDSGIWASDTGPAADKDGNVFVATGNGHFDVAKGGRDYGDSFLKLSLNGQHLSPSDYFAPFDVDALDADDKDLGSGGPLLLPDQPGPHPHLALVGGKDATIYVIDRDDMGHYQTANDSHAVQTISLQGGIYGSMAYWNHNVYVEGSGDHLRDFEVKNGKLSLKAINGNTFQNNAATPTISANGVKDGIVWVLITKGWNAPDRPEVLHAYDALDIAHELYNSNYYAARDQAGQSLRFNTPTVMNGHVYIGAKHEVDVYGLLPTSAKK
jgi:hypothetical protein